MLNSKSKETLRWISLPFATFIGAFLGCVLLVMFQWFSMKMWSGYISENGWYYRYIMPFLSSVFFGYFFSTISLEVAPKHKVIATTVMVTLLGVLCLASLFIAWSMQTTRGVGYFIETLFGTIGGMIAAVSTLVNYKKIN